MDIKLAVGAIAEIAADVVILALAETGEQPPTPSGLDGAIQSWIADLYSSGEFKGKLFELATLHRPQGMKAKRLTVVGTGKPDESSNRELRLAIATGLRNVKKFSPATVVIAISESTVDNVAAATEGAILGNWESDCYKSPQERKPVGTCMIAPASGGSDIEKAFNRARIIAESQNFTRDLQNEPPNELTPLNLAERARAMAGEQGLECEILDQDRMRQLGMGSLLGVAQGSVEPPALIVIRYQPANGSGSRKDHLGLVGKGVTFDTGGISIKPADNMDKMKYDMSGGAAMIGAMRAIAQLKPAIPVTALIPTVENMPGGKAQRPGDIVKSLSGKTIEVLNTDAEGRLILNDAITYAKRLGCTHLVDAATLTGAIVVALGYIYVGVFTNNETFGDKLLAAAKRQGEKMWPMPLDDDYKELLKSPFADIANIGGRWGGAITAAMFLKEFADDTPWIHLDIAGTASYDDGKPYAAKGASGVCVRTFVDLAVNW
jgi:leucyl aminopeptidase